MRRVALVAPLRRTESGSGTFLALADDGSRYWVKAPGNPQGDRTLVSEVIVQGIGHLIGAPVVETCLIAIPDGTRWKYTSQDVLRGGTGHASRDISDAIVSDEWSPFTHLDGNRRRQSFLVALWDLCMGGDEQWLHEVGDDYGIWSFHHGFWLGGDGDWDIQSIRRTGTRPWVDDLDVALLSRSALRDAADAVDDLQWVHLDDVMARVPVEWGATEAELAAVAEVLFSRVEGVAERLRAASQRARHE